MCGKVIQSSAPIRYAILEGMDCATAASTTIRRGGTAGLSGTAHRGVCRAPVATRQDCGTVA